MMRVVIPAFRAGATLPACVRALVSSSCSANLEIVVVDDGENGDLAELLSPYRVSICQGRQRASAALARNLGAMSFKGDELVFVDADVEVEKQTIEQLTRPIREGRAEATIGNYSADVAGLNFAQSYKQLYIATVHSRQKRELENQFWTGIGAIRTSVFRELGGFMSRFPGAEEEDTELGQRITRAGGRILAVPDACGKHLKKSNVRKLILNDLHKGISTIHITCSARVPIKHVRHSSRRDMIAVASACALASVPVVWWAVAPSNLAVVLLVTLLMGVFLAARGDLLAVNIRHGAWFLTRATVMMYVLDIVRGLCVPLGLLEVGKERVGRAWARTRALGRLFVPGVKMPIYVMLFVTSRCNAKCGHCFFWRDQNKNVRDELKIDEIESLAKCVGPALQVTLTGGSPELRRDLPEIARLFYHYSNPVNLTICMTGYFTDVVLAHVAEILHTCRNRNLTIGLSLDGIGPEHDAIRGLPGLFDRVVATFSGLAAMRGANPRLRLACAITVSGLNYKTAERTVEWAWENLPIDLLKPILVRGSPRDERAMNDECFQSYVSIVRREEERLRANEDSRSTGFALLVRAKEIVQRGLITEIYRTGASPVVCSAMRENVVIYPDGTIRGCELRSEEIGNLRNVSMDVSKVWSCPEACEFRSRVQQERCGCYHHCFLSPPIFRSPRLWPKLAGAAWGIWKYQSPSRH